VIRSHFQLSIFHYQLSIPNSPSYLYFMTAWINNRFVPYEEALLPVSDLSIQRGYALFDFLRSVNSIPLFLSCHLDRFFGSADGLHLTVPYTREQLGAVVQELIQLNRIDEAGIRLLLTGGVSPDTYHPATPNLVITCLPVRTASETDFENGLRLITYEHQRELPQIKSINYLTGVWLQPLLRQQQADDVLYHSNGQVTESPRSNVFIVSKEGSLCTPAAGILHGITRKKVLELAGGLLPVEERAVSLQEVYSSSEMFITSTTRRLLPVRVVDGRLIGNGKPGSVTCELYRRFRELEEGLRAGGPDR
jgi:D-alanine transaminase/branched-chain amino acid aminotransferase